MTENLPTLASATTFHVGGPVASWQNVTSEEEFIDAIRRADEAKRALLVLGGGSNLLASDEPFDGVVVRDLRRDIEVLGEGQCETQQVIYVGVTAGTVWDDFVQWACLRGYSGVEALSGIPGSVGAAPVQNVGAYGGEVADTIYEVTAWDRLKGERVCLSAEDLQFAYRMSTIKKSVEDPASEAAGGRVWGPTGRWVVLDVTFALLPSALSVPIRYKELAHSLGVEVGECALLQDVREHVLQLRNSKGMVVNEADHDTWSAGSFFTNPILSLADAECLLPAEAPRFPVSPADGGVNAVKTSAAWLIEHAGCSKGWHPADLVDADGQPRASLSTKHTLALTNRGNASAADIHTLALAVREQVRATFGITLLPEPVTVGLSWE